MSSDGDATSRGARLRALLGLGSVLAVAACTLWLAASGHLDLYINPRYAVFTVVLAVVAVLASGAGLVVLARGTEHVHGDEDHVHDDGAPRARSDAPHDAGRVRDDATGRSLPRERGRRQVLGGIAGSAGAVVTVGVVVAMTVLPPTTLSARTAQQRSVDAGGTLSAASGTGGTVSLLGSGSVDTSHYGVKDWAALIRQSTDTTALVGKRVTLTGFVVPGQQQGTFTVTRFVISCCAVDAQPVGVGVTTDGTAPDADRWVRVTGALAANPDVSSSARLVLRAASVRAVAQPEDPYEY